MNDTDPIKRTEARGIWDVPCFLFFREAIRTPLLISFLPFTHYKFPNFSDNKIELSLLQILQ